MSNFTYRYWEQDVHNPMIDRWPGIIAFLGDEPFREPKTLGEFVRAYRRRSGLTGEIYARQLGIDPGTLRRIEADSYKKIDPRIADIVEELRAQFRP